MVSVVLCVGKVIREDGNMSLVLIYGDRFSGEEDLARSLAESLGYRLVEPDTVIERAAAWGGSQLRLARILADPPDISVFSCGVPTIRYRFSRPLWRQRFDMETWSATENWRTCYCTKIYLQSTFRSPPPPSPGLGP